MASSWQPPHLRRRSLAPLRAGALMLTAYFGSLVAYQHSRVHPVACLSLPAALERSVAARGTPPVPVAGDRVLRTLATYNAAADQITFQADPITDDVTPLHRSKHSDLSVYSVLSMIPVGLVAPVATRYELTAIAAPTGAALPRPVLARAEAAHLDAVAASARSPTPHPALKDLAPRYARARAGPFITSNPLGLLLNILFIAGLVDAARIAARALRWRRADRRYAQGRCLSCGYDLTTYWPLLALPTCPECGQPNPTHRDT